MISTFRNYAWLVINPISGFAVRLGVTLLFTVFEHKLFFFCSIEWTWYSSSSTLPSHIALWVVILHLHTTGGSCGLPGTDLEPHCAHTHIQTTQMRLERKWKCMKVTSLSASLLNRHFDTSQDGYCFGKLVTWTFRKTIFENSKFKFSNRNYFELERYFDSLKFWILKIGRRYGACRALCYNTKKTAYAQVFWFLGYED